MLRFLAALALVSSSLAATASVGYYQTGATTTPDADSTPSVVDGKTISFTAVGTSSAKVSWTAPAKVCVCAVAAACCWRVPVF